MRVMFAVSSWPGHYYPMVPLGWALQSAGHDVRVACAPSQAEAVTRAGLTPVPILDGMDLVFLTRVRYLMDAREGNWPYPWRPLHPVTGEEVSDLGEFSLEQYISDNTASTFGAMIRSFTAVTRFAKSWQPGIVVHDPLSTEGQLAAAVTGVPAVTHLWGPTGTHEPPSSAIQIVPEYPPGTFARWKISELGLKQVRHVIDPCPRALAPPAGLANRLPVRYVPYNGPGAAAGWAGQRPGKPRVCVVWGTSTTAMSGPGSFILPDVIRALAGLDAEIVVTATAADLDRAGELPDGVRAAERVPLNQLLPTCSAVVHHGGAGCLMTAISAGVPQLALTFAIEQALNGERLAATGAGAHLPGHQAGPGSVRAAVTDLLDKPSYLEAAGQLQESSRLRPTPAKLVGYLAGIAAGGA